MKVVINPGSVGQPRDENPAAAYGIFDTEQHKIWIKRVDYDIEAAMRAIDKANLPRILGERLRPVQWPGLARGIAGVTR